MLSTFSFSDDTVGFLFEGDFNKKTVGKLISQIESKFDFYDKINLYLEDVNIDSFNLAAVWEEITFKLKHEERFNKIALVTNRKWIKACSMLCQTISSANMKTFSSEERLDALTWISHP
ncbi:SpoIIAA family protein [Luteirhabdus pelagi]|uniref:STAS/SEC14 domain-containing protein n=1 Tax=Luteirhabdus pelagi TaxID=2792783 RepID=UPI00193962CD|nr:STAS/SEC14 domain-containing protein [Luteirhabdus pelagi]